MGQYKRITSKLPHPGPWLGIITNHLDPTYMGCLEVALTKAVTDSGNIQGETVVVNYLSPFYGVTSIQFEGTNSADFNDAQKSYGFWAVPPDIGTTVMCMFVGGDPNAGYWMGCVPDRYQNHMVPGMAASQNVEMTPEQERKYGTRNVPVAEFTKKNRDMKIGKPNAFNKPIHPFADRLLAQGLLLDTIRGVTSSSARREVPSMVFGISTPGPVDTSPGAKRGQIGYDSKATIPVSRLGGSTFVMDDGDQEGQNELVRLRTRTGHQILMHNSHDLIYIANSKGTAWIELTSNGKIDIYAQDSVSIHSDVDFNFRANRDINIEAGRNINIKANKAMDVNITDHLFMIVENNVKLNFAKNVDATVGNSVKWTIGDNLDINVGDDIKQTAGANIHVNAGGTLFTTAPTINETATTWKLSASDINQSASGDWKVSGGTTNINSGHHIETAGTIDMNGPAAAVASAATAASTAASADIPTQIPTYRVPTRTLDAGWSDGNFYKGAPLNTIMQRVPMHEPWDQHENINPAAFTPQNTDTAATARSDVESSGNTASPANLESSLPGTCSIAASKAIGAPSAQAGIAALKAACAKAGITSPYAVAAILGIAGGESGWIPQSEKYFYTPERLKVIFRSASDSVVQQYSRWTGSPATFFEFFYGGAAGSYRSAGFLGNTTSGDGGKFYGRGYIQLTGKGNYARYSKLAFPTEPNKLIDSPDLVNDPSIGAEVAVAYFKDRVKLSQTDPSYINAAISAVGYNSPDIHQRKMDYYQCFLAQLQGTTASTQKDSQGNTTPSGTGTQ